MAQEPLEFSGPKKKMQTVTKKEIYSRLLEILKLEGDGKNEHNNSEALGKLNQIITENP
jgi:hypothetical protein